MAAGMAFEPRPRIQDPQQKAIEDQKREEAAAKIAAKYDLDVMFVVALLMKLEERGVQPYAAVQRLMNLSAGEAAQLRVLTESDLADARVMNMIMEQFAVQRQQLNESHQQAMAEGVVERAPQLTPRVDRTLESGALVLLDGVSSTLQAIGRILAGKGYDVSVVDGNLRVADNAGSSTVVETPSDNRVAVHQRNAEGASVGLYKVKGDTPEAQAEDIHQISTSSERRAIVVFDPRLDAQAVTSVFKAIKEMAAQGRFIDLKHSLEG